jgi:hypothetical protein
MPTYTGVHGGQQQLINIISDPSHSLLVGGPSFFIFVVVLRPRCCEQGSLYFSRNAFVVLVSVVTGCRNIVCCGSLNRLWLKSCSTWWCFSCVWLFVAGLKKKVCFAAEGRRRNFENVVFPSWLV